MWTFLLAVVFYFLFFFRLLFSLSISSMTALWPNTRILQSLRGKIFRICYGFYTFNVCSSQEILKKINSSFLCFSRESWPFFVTTFCEKMKKKKSTKVNQKFCSQRIFFLDDENIKYKRKILLDAQTVSGYEWNARKFSFIRPVFCAKRLSRNSWFFPCQEKTEKVVN